jgi:hypothetical protein
MGRFEMSNKNIYEQFDTNGSVDGPLEFYIVAPPTCDLDTLVCLVLDAGYERTLEQATESLKKDRLRIEQEILGDEEKQWILSQEIYKVIIQISKYEEK